VTEVGVARTIALEGLVPVPVRVEAHVTRTGLPGFSVLGLSGAVGQQACSRVRAALAAVRCPIGQAKVTVSLSPADTPKRGARFDLPIAVAILRALGAVPSGHQVVLGELSLLGAVLPVRGVLPSVRGQAAVVVAAADAAEAAVAGVPRVLGVGDLDELVRVLEHGDPPADPPTPLPADGGPPPDLSDVIGQAEARRALELAAAGGHHLLLMGPPGTGKSMLARRLPGLLPPLDDDQAVTVAAIASVAGRLAPGTALDRRPPFAAPHHSSSAAALLGGGTGLAAPGAISLATHGVLFLDELLQWSSRTLDGLREPMEEGVVHLARSAGSVTYPAAFLLVAASNPCPCGPPATGCRCRPEAVARYRARLTGPLADRIDLAPAVDPVPAEALATGGAGEPTAAVAARVAAARARSAARGPRLNAAAPAAAVRATAVPAAVEVLVRAVARGRLTARGFDRALRVARTCADLDGRDRITADDAHEAVAHRARMDATWERAA
jgi:magnesium chelatase family protein